MELGDPNSADHDSLGAASAEEMQEPDLFGLQRPGQTPGIWAGKERCRHGGRPAEDESDGSGGTGNMTARSRGGLGENFKT